MSTKIHNGYLLPKMPFEKLHRHMHVVQKALRAEAQLIVAELIGEKVEKILTAHALGTALPAEDFVYDLKKDDTKREVHPLGLAWGFLSTKFHEIAKSDYRDPRYDLDTTWVIIPHKGKMLCIFYSEHTQLHQIFARVARAKPYPYWDNADGPDKVSKKAWNARGKEWDEALAYGSPGESGWVMSMWGRYGHSISIEPEERKNFVRKLNAQLPPVKRARRIAVNELTGKRMEVQKRRHLKKSPQEKEKNLPIYLYSRWYHEATDWLGTPAGQKALEKKTRALRKKLRAITVKDLTTTIEINRIAPRPPQDDFAPASASAAKPKKKK